MISASTNNIKSLRIIHTSLITGQIIFAAIAFYIVYNKLLETTLQQYEKIFQVISILCSVGGYLLGNWLFKKRIAMIRTKHSDVFEKFKAYKEVSIIQWMLIEVPCFFCMVSFIFIGNYAFLMLAISLIIVFIFFSPSKEKTIFHLKLFADDAMQLYN